MRVKHHTNISNLSYVPPEIEGIEVYAKGTDAFQKILKKRFGVLADTIPENYFYTAIDPDLVDPKMEVGIKIKRQLAAAWNEHVKYLCRRANEANYGRRKKAIRQLKLYDIHPDFYRRKNE
jgi:hypothetical protein